MTLRTIVNIMKEWKLTTDEMFHIELIIHHQNGTSNELTEFIAQQNGYLEKMIFDSLCKKEIIHPFTHTESETNIEISVSSVKFTDKFLSNHFVFADICGPELICAYPAYIDINGKQCSALTISKSFHSREEMFITYGRKIKFSKELHTKILESLKYAVQNNLISFGIAEYIIGEHWKQHIKEMDIKQKQKQKSKYIE
jgi:hypothetical protein